MYICRRNAKGVKMTRLPKRRKTWHETRRNILNLIIQYLTNKVMLFV